MEQETWIWNVDLESPEFGQHLVTLTGQEWLVLNIAISPDGKTGLSASWDETIRLWDLDTGACLRTFEGHVGEINAVKYSPDGHYAFSCGGDEKVRMWHLESSECMECPSSCARVKTSLRFP